MKRICVFCGSSPGSDPAYLEAATAMGTELARRGIGLVYGGGRVGLMGACAEAVAAGGGDVIGVIPHGLVVREVGNLAAGELRVVDSMHERKATMASLSDAFVSLPGGMGTLEETAEMLTWAQLGIHRKPCAVLDVAGFYAPLLAFLDRAVETGFVRPEHRRLLVVGTEPAALLDALEAYEPPALEKWITRDET